MADDTTTEAGAQTAGEAGQSTNTPGLGMAGTGPATTTTGATPLSNSGATADQGQPKPGEKTFSQADIDKIIKARLDDEKRKAEQKRAAEAGEWQKLAQQHEADLTSVKGEFETLKGRVESYEQAVQAMYAARIKALPAAAKRAVESMPISDPLDRLAWLEANADLFTAQQPPNINATERGETGARSKQDDIELWRRLGLTNAVRAAQGNKE